MSFDGVILVSVVCLAFIPYLMNIYKLYKNISSQEYSFKTLFRVAGVLFPIVGFFMGFV